MVAETRQLRSHTGNNCLDVGNAIATETTQRNYDLNEARALSKKQDHTARTPLEVEINEQASQVQLTCSAGFFEAIKQALLSHFQPMLDAKQATSRKAYDKTKTALTEICIKYKGHYTVSIYNTTSRINVNGRRYKDFLDVTKNLCQNIDIRSADALNKHISDVLQHQNGDTEGAQASSQAPIKQVKDANKSSPKTYKSLPRRKAGRRKASRTTSSIIPIHTNAQVSDSSEEEEEFDCPTCQQPVTVDCDALECAHCNEWTHMKCDKNITPHVYNKHKREPNLPYSCPRCTLLSVTDPSPLSSNKTQSTAAPHFKKLVVKLPPLTPQQSLPDHEDSTQTYEPTARAQSAPAFTIHTADNTPLLISGPPPHHFPPPGFQHIPPPGTPNQLQIPKPPPGFQRIPPPGTSNQLQLPKPTCPIARRIPTQTGPPPLTQARLQKPQAPTQARLPKLLPKSMPPMQAGKPNHNAENHIQEQHRRQQKTTMILTQIPPTQSQPPTQDQAASQTNTTLNSTNINPTNPLDLLQESDKLDRRERILKTQEKDLQHRDKLLKQKELDLRHNIQRATTQDAYIRTLEEKVDNLERVIEKMQATIRTNSTINQNQPSDTAKSDTAPIHPQAQNENIQVQLQQHYINELQMKLLEQRFNHMESTFLSQTSNMESTFRSQVDSLSSQFTVLNNKLVPSTPYQSWQSQPSSNVPPPQTQVKQQMPTYASNTPQGIHQVWQQHQPVVPPLIQAQPQPSFYAPNKLQGTQHVWQQRMPLSTQTQPQPPAYIPNTLQGMPLRTQTQPQPPAYIPNAFQGTQQGWQKTQHQVPYQTRTQAQTPDYAPNPLQGMQQGRQNQQERHTEYPRYQKQPQNSTQIKSPIPNLGSPPSSNPEIQQPHHQEKQTNCPQNLSKPKPATNPPTPSVEEMPLINFENVGETLSTTETDTGPKINFIKTDDGSRVSSTLLDMTNPENQDDKLSGRHNTVLIKSLLPTDPTTATQDFLEVASLRPENK